MRVAAAVAATLLLGAGAAGCGRADPGPPGTSPTPPRLADRATDPPPTAGRTAAGPATGIRYRLPDRMCRVADLGPLTEIFPKQQDKALVDAPGLCDTAVMSATMVVGITVNAELLPNADRGKDYHDTARRLARGTPTDIGGAGSAAFWTGGPNKVELVTYHGNLALHITCETVNDRQQLPADIAARLARVAAGTFVRLAP